jgi:hypothetical protein
VKPNPPTVGEQRHREGIRLQVLEPHTGEIELTRDRRHVDDAVRHRVRVEAVAGDRLLRPRATARTLRRLEYDHLDPAPRQVARRHEPVVAATDD